MEFGILGPLAVWRDGRELELGAAKQRALLAVLLLHAGETMATARLVDALWDEHPPATAVKALQVYVSKLRKTLGDRVVETKPAGYLLRVEDGALDLQRFEHLLAHGRQLLADGAAAEASETLREAVALWRGPALADFRYEPFAQNESARLEELRLSALELRLEADLALGRSAEAVPELELLAREHPLRENLRRLLILALYRSGRQADALAAYQNAKATLVDELGLDPSQVLQQLEKAILRQDSSLDSPDTRPGAAPKTVARPASRPPTPPPFCAGCGTTNAYGAEFCHSCGAALAADVLIERRKTVTVVFCDVVAYTALAGRLDPEALRHVMSHFFEFAADTIEQHGGTVEKFIGDEVMAVFGVPAVHEDDALRAVRAAVELRDGVPALETALGSSARLEVRIGINTGEVVAGDPAAGHGFVTGEAVAVGKRLQQSAAAGEVLLGETTHALVSHAIEASPLEPLALKGVEDEATAFRLDSIRPDATALPRRDDTPLVGRERELEQLGRVFAEVSGGHGARQVTIVGEPGIGKSRLARAFLAEVDAEATVLVGRCPPYGEGITFWPLRELLQQAGHSEDELEGTTHEVFSGVRRILVELARDRPLVVVFDDVHWAEPTFLDFVEYLCGHLGEAPVLLLCLARSQLAEQRPAWLQEPAASSVLQPLSEDDSQRLLEELGAPLAVRSRIAEAAEGNPLFVEQLAAMADQNGAGDAMPGSIRGVLHERLDRLEQAERSLLERAAVVGRSFSLEALLDLTEAEERESVHAHLLALARKRLVRPDSTTPDDSFRFHHALIRDAAYDGVPKARRADLHERVAARLEAQAAEDALVGYHLERSFRFRRELGQPDVELGVRAGRLLRSAGQTAFNRSDLPATVSLFERAVDLLAPPESAQLLPRLGQALFEAGRFEDAEAVLAAAIQHSDADAALASRARVEQAFVRLQVGSDEAIDAAHDVAASALRAFEDCADAFGQCRAWCLSAWIEWTAGHATRADEAWQRAASHARAAGEERELHEILGWRASAAVGGPTPVPEAIRICTEIRRQVLGDPVAAAVTLHPLATLHAMGGDFDEARSLIREANTILEGVGRMNSAVSHHEALVATLAGDPTEAEQLMRPGYRKLEAMGEKALLATTAAMLAQATYAQQRYDEADRFCAVAENTAAPADMLTQVIWRGVRAKLLAQDGLVEEGEALALDAVRLVADTDLLCHHGDALLDLAEVFRLRKQPDDAAAAVREAAGLYDRKGNTVSAERARSRISSPAAK